MFWGKDLKDVFYQDEILQMVAKIQEYDEDKLFKITRLNFQGKTKDWYRSLNSAPLDWQTLQIIMMEKYGVYDGEELKVKMDAIRQELRQRVQLYYDRLE